MACYHRLRWPPAQFPPQRRHVPLLRICRHRKIQASVHLLPLSEPPPTAVHGAVRAPRGHGLKRRSRSVEAEASATMRASFRSVCSVKGIRQIGQVGTHTNSSAMSGRLLGGEHASTPQRGVEAPRPLKRSLPRLCYRRCCCC